MMSPLLASTALTWLALLIVYLGLAATLRKVHFLEAEMRSMRTGDRARPIGVDLRLPGLAVASTPDAPKARLVVAVDSACPSCRLTVDELVDIAPTLGEPPILLTYETPDTWGHAAKSLRIRRDPESWRALAHLSPPILMTVDGDGNVADLILVSQPHQVTRAAAAWGFAKLAQRSLT